MGVAVEGDLAAAGDADVVEGDVAHDGWEVSLELAAGGVAGVEDDGVGGVADADVVEDDVVDEAAAGAVGFDADGVVEAVEGEIEDAEFCDSANGDAADGHAVAPVEVAVADGHVVDAAGATFDGDVVVAGADVGLGDGDVFCAVAGVDAVGVASEAFGGVDFYSPDGEAVAAVVVDVGVLGVAKGDAVEGEVVGVTGFDDA